MTNLYFSAIRKNRVFIKLLGICLCVMFAMQADAQVNVTGNQTATNLAQKLVGTGVVVMNPTLTCPSVANGIFTVVSSNLGLDSGIVLTSGRAATQGTLIGINGISQDNNGPSNDNGAPGDAQLTTLAGVPTHDACVLQFDFRPQGDTIKFKYVFGSVEYQGYTCSSFNDVFGFLISGPGYTSPTNIAYVPGTTIPVSVNSVNGATAINNPNYSVCTAVGPGSPFNAYYINNASGTTITYYGFTTILQAIATVNPCDTYHLKLGVADASDWALDSGVFIEAGSLSSTSVHIQSVGINGQIPFCVRGCTPGKFIFTIPNVSADSLTYHFLVAGSAQNGYDYSPIPDSVVIPPGDTTDTLFINPQIVPPTGPKTVALYILASHSCDSSNTIVDSAFLTIYDSFNVHIITPDTGICIGNSVNIIAESDSFLSYSWSPAAGVSNDTVLNPVITPGVSTTYVLTANLPGAGCAPSQSAINIKVYQPPTLITPNVLATCVGTPAQFWVNATPDTQLYSYSWTPALYLANPDIDSAVATPTVEGDVLYTVTVNNVIPSCGTTDTIFLHVLPNSFTINNPFDTVCIGDTVQISALGDAEFAYVWAPVTGVSDPHIINPAITPPSAPSYPTTDMYTVTASYPGCPNMIDTVNITVDTSAPTTPISKSTCVGIPIQFDVTVHATGTNTTNYQYSWAPATYLSSDTIPNPIDSPTAVGDVTYVVTVTPGAQVCKVHDTVSIHILPNDFTINNGDTAICKGASIQITGIGDTEFVYTWIPTGGVSNYHSLTPLLTPDTTTDYTITATYPGCPDMVHTLNVDVQPVPSLFLNTDKFTCQKDTVTFSPVITPWGYPYIYTWSPTTYLSDTTGPNAVFTGTDTGTFIITLNVSTPAGCQAQDSTYVTIYPGQFATLLTTSDTAICPGDSLQFAATGAISYQWTPGLGLADSTSASTEANPTTNSNYTLVATSQYGCHDTFGVNVVVHPAALINLGDSVTLYPGETYQMNPQGNCLYFAWFPPLGLSATNIADPIANPDASTKYYVTGTTEYGCSLIDSINVVVDPNTLLAMPNAFTPGNGPNNELKIIKRGIATLNYFRIFNRWGEQVFSTGNIDQGWDGTLNGSAQPFGVYVYEIEAETNTGKRFYKQGNVTLLR